MAVDAWSYQLHSKEPNVFPLKMMEATWKDADFNKGDWEDQDHMKFAFICGFLTHVATDQIIHPVVNKVAGSYYKRLKSRDKHRECEIHQDIYALAQHRGCKLTTDAYCAESFSSWCNVGPEPLYRNEAIWFRYFIQKAFIEAHAVAPDEETIGDWIKGIESTLKWFIHPKIPLEGLAGPYGTAHTNLIKSDGSVRTDSQAYLDYIQLVPVNSGRAYDSYFAEALKLATVYIKAANRAYLAPELTDSVRESFLSVVQSADLGAPLEGNILERATAALAKWPS
jgi:hypothetical protein